MRSAPLEADAEPTVSLVDWLERDGTELVDELDRLYVPRNDPRWLRRNALVALGNVGRPEDAPLAERVRWTATTRCSPRRPRGRSPTHRGAGRSDRTSVSRVLAHELRSPVAALDGARRTRRRPQQTTRRTSSGWSRSASPRP